jgi:hypothetical protein
MYDLRRDPLEMTNLAHATHRTPASDVERARLHERLSRVMKEKGTTPDEIRWPDADDYRRAAGIGRDARLDPADALSVGESASHQE